MQEFEDLKAVVVSALAKVQDGKVAATALAAEQAAHAATRDALNAVNSDMTKMRDEIVALKGQLATAIAG